MFCKILIERLALLAALLVCTLPAQAQLGFNRHGVKFYQELDLHLSDAKSCTPLSDGRLAFVWSQADLDGIRRIHLQIVSANQQLAFPENPPALSLNRHSDSPIACSAADGGAFVAWLEPRGNYLAAVMLQKIRSDGSSIWRRGGIEVDEIFLDLEPELDICISSEGNCFISASYRRNESALVFAMRPNGEAVQGWPECGVGFNPENGNKIMPDPWGGFWVPTSNASFNRIRANGSIVWRRPVVIDPPGENNLYWNGIQAGANYLFGIFGGDEDHHLTATVYDSSGQRVAIDNFVNRNPDADGAYLNFKVTSDDRLIVLFNHYLVHGDWEDYWEESIEPVKAIIYAPGEQEHFPWGTEGNPVDDNIGMWSFAWSFRAFEVGENYLLNDGFLVYPFDRDGNRVADRHLIDVPDIENSFGYPQLYPAGDFVWVHDGEPEFPFACRLNALGEREEEEAISALIFGQRDLERYYIFPTPNGGLDVVWQDKWRGMVGQNVDADGNLSSSVLGEVRDSLWVSGIYDSPFTGTLGDDHWLWRWINTWSGWLDVFDADGNTVTSRQLNFDQQGLSSGYSDKGIPSNGSDRFFSIYRTEDRSWRIFQFDRNGNIEAGSDILAHGAFKFFRYWPGQGWFMLTTENNMWYSYLYNDEFESIWQGIEMGPSRIGDDNLTPNDVVFHDTTATVYRIDHRSHRLNTPLFRTVVGASSTLLSSDTLVFFGESKWSSSLISLKPASDGGWWLIINDDGQDILQRLSSDGEQMLGFAGMVIRDGHASYDSIELLTDAEGGAWIVWGEEGTIRATHLNSDGQRVADIYPEEGLDVFGNNQMRWSRATIDPNTGQVWVTATRQVRGDDFALYSEELWVQLLGDELAVDDDVRVTPESFYLETCYPSPFNQNATIVFSLPEESLTTLRIYDLSGRLAMDLTPTGSLKPGRHSVVWNAEGLAAGIYLVRLESGGRSIVKRAVLVK